MWESSWWNWKAAYDCNFEFNLRDNYAIPTTTAKIPIIKMTKVVQAGRLMIKPVKREARGWNLLVYSTYILVEYLFSPNRYRKVHVRLQSVIIRIEFLPIRQNTHLYLLTTNFKNINFPNKALEISFPSPSLDISYRTCLLINQPWRKSSFWEMFFCWKIQIVVIVTYFDECSTLLPFPHNPTSSWFLISNLVVYIYILLASQSTLYSTCWLQLVLFFNTVYLTVWVF